VELRGLFDANFTLKVDIWRFFKMPVYDTKTRGKIRVPYTKKELVQRWRKKQTEKGGRNLSVWMKPETVETMNRLLDKYPGKSRAAIVAIALQKLHNDTAREA